MRHTLLAFLPLLLLTTAFKGVRDIKPDREEAQKVFTLINDIRLHPEQYKEQMKLSSGLVITRTELVWNETLAKVAEEKALDMARRQYFAHVNPEGYGINYLIQKAGYKLIPDFVKDKRANTFESIQAGGRDALDVVTDLVIDDGVPSKGHRNHLLGIGQWNASLKDIGIGYVVCNEGCTYRTYVSIVIAKHDW